MAEIYTPSMAWPGGQGTAIPTVDLYSGVPRAQVAGTISSVATSKIIRTTNATSSVTLGWRFTVNPGDTTTAGDRLAEDGVDCGWVPLNDKFILGVSGREATTIYVALVATTAYINAAGTILPTGTSSANTQTVMAAWVFEAGTRAILLESTPQYVATTDKVLLMARGYIDA